MVSNKLDRTITSESFDYGEHEIVVRVRISNEYLAFRGHGYWRWVEVHADTEDGTEVSNKSVATLNPDLDVSVSLLDRLRCLLSGTDIETVRERRRREAAPPTIEAQIENTVHPVLAELDTIYGYLDRTYDIDVEVGLERVRHEISWVEVDSEIDRISAELASGEVPAT